MPWIGAQVAYEIYFSIAQSLLIATSGIKGQVNWLRLNYAPWPTWMIPTNHQYSVGEREQKLKEKVKVTFSDTEDYFN